MATGWGRTICLAGVILLLAGCGSNEPNPLSAPAVESDSHTRMIAVLEDVRRRTADEHPFLGTRALHVAEQELADAQQVGDASPDLLCRLHGQFAEELLRCGRASEAVQEMRTALDLFPASANPEVHKHVHYRAAIACLRLGENVNCVQCASGASCLLPIRKEGVHTDPSGSRMAVEHLLAVLEIDPADLRAIWLLNVAHMTLGSYPQDVPERFLIPERVFAAEATDIRPFLNVARQLGMDTRNPAGSVVIDDFDGDDHLDVLTSSWDTGEPLRLFRNNRDGTFSEEIDAARLAGLFGGLNMIQADYDNDGDVDVLVLRGAWLEQYGRHPSSLLQNDGHARFRDVTFDVGLGDVHYPTQTAAWADYDNDGDLDLYVGNERYPSQLFENDGSGVFKDVAPRAGVQNLELAKAVVWGDFDQDGWPDLYVSNLPGENRLYRNNRDGTFTDVARALGVERPFSSFPAWFWDFNNDGLLDLYVSSFEPGIAFVAADYLQMPITCEPDRLYRGTPDHRFEEVARDVQFTRVTQPMGSNFGDINNDGFLDLYFGTGYVDYEGLMPNLLFVNREGQKFEDVTFAAGVGHLQKGHGVAFADLDNDGDQEIFAQMGGWFAGDAFPNAVFENPGTEGNWIGIHLVGQESNRSAIGAQIHVQIDDAVGQRSIFRWVNSGGSFGANPLRQHIGLGQAEVVSLLEVHWPTTGLVQTFTDVSGRQSIEIVEGKSDYRTLAIQPLNWGD